MKRYIYLTCVFSLLVCGCATNPRNVVFQTSTIDALLAGVYDGDTSCGELLKHGDFGIGTFDHLDGEMAILNGVVYQIKSDGKVYTPALSVNTPFATVCSFMPEQKFDLESESDYDLIKAFIDEKAPNQNLFCAIKISGKFKSMHTRSVPAQRPLAHDSCLLRDQSQQTLLSRSAALDNTH